MANSPFEVPNEMRDFAERSVEQARKAFEKFMANAQATAGTIEQRRDTVRAGAKEIGAKAVSYAETNVQASLDYAQSLLKAKDLPEVMKLHSDFVQGQMKALAEQASEMGQIVSRAAMDAARPKTWAFSMRGCGSGPGPASGPDQSCGNAPEIALRCTKLT